MFPCPDHCLLYHKKCTETTHRPAHVFQSGCIGLEERFQRGEVRHAAELFSECSAAHRVRRGAAAGGHGAAHLSGQCAGRRGDGAVSAGAGGLFAVCHAGHGGHCSGSGPPADRRAEPRCRCRPGNDAVPAGSRAGPGAAGNDGTGAAGGAGGAVVAGGSPGSRSTPGVFPRDAMDGGLFGAARFFSGAAADQSQCAQSAGGADGAHRGGGADAFPHPGLG